MEITLRRILSGTGHIAFSGEELCTVAINGSRTFDTNVLRISTRDHHYVSVARGNAVTCFVVFGFGTTQKFALRCQMESYITFQLDSADNEVTRGDQHRPTLIPVARVDRSLHCHSI